MSLFKRSVVSEIMSHAGIVFSTLLVVWLSVLLVRLLGEAANGDIGANVVLGLAAFSSITALPVILSVALFIAVLTTVKRNYRERSEEHTSELQSLMRISYAVFCLKKKQQRHRK